MPPDITPVPKPDWMPLTARGVRNVEGKVLLVLDNLTVALLRLGVDGCVPERAAPYATDVVCIDGGGFTEVEGEEAELKSGYTVRWPANARRRLWTETETMTVLVIEHFRAG